MSPDTENSHPEHVEPADAEIEATEAMPSSDDDGESGPDDRVSELEAQCEALTLKYQRSVADYQNLARRSQQSEVQARQLAKSSVIRDLLPILDNLDRALGQETQEGAAEGLRQGIVLVRDELLKMLGSHGVAPIRVEPGDEFDPNAHEAMMHVDADGIKENHVAQLLQVGYGMGDVILRPAKVSLARGGSQDAHGDDD